MTRQLKRTLTELRRIPACMSQPWGRLARVVSAFAADRRGVVAILFVLALVPIVAAGGAAVDLSRAYTVKQRLGNALDAAGLAVGSTSGLSDNELNTLAQKYFDANYPAEELGVPATPQLTISDSEIVLTATADIDTTLMRIAQIDSITVAAATTIKRETKGLEVVLVLDNTGSMFGSKMTSLKEASVTFVDLLFGDEAEPEFLKVGIVPFTGTVNVGTDETFREKYITAEPSDQAFNPDHWRGCVEAREHPFDTTDDSQLEPDLGGGKWKPYLYPDNRFVNPWFFLRNDRANHMFVGPNKSCPVELLPLTNVKEDVLDKIDEMIANGVTHINLGAVWGWRVLSPGEPYTNGAAYNDEKTNKAIVIMTDGSNFVSSFGPRYAGYGTFTERRLGNNRFQAQNELDRRLTEVCTKMKELDILVYTITFQLFSRSIQNLMRNCATDSGKYFNSPSGDDLEQAFQSIGAELSNLRIGN
jgi:Flp pilus assembly protein TadG